MKTKPSILVVDDEKVICEGLARLLSVHYTTYQARNGKEAIEVIRNNHIDVVLCDIVMPEMDGNELIKKLRSENQDIIMIVITANPNPQKVCEAMRQGANNFMCKPLDIPLLEMTINNAVRKKIITYPCDR